MPDSEREQNPSRRIATAAAAALLTVAGLVAGWLTAMGVLALPLPEGALFALAGLVALGAFVGAYYLPRWWARAPLIGGVVGVAVSVALVLIVVRS